MSDAAAPAAATAAPAPNGAAPAAEPSKDASATETPPDPKESLDAHVAHAIKQAKRQAAAEKGKRTKAEKAAAKPAAKPEPAKAEPAQAEQEEEPEAKPARSGKTPRQLLDEGDIDGAFLEAFGKKPGDLNINSKRWAEHHKAVKRDREKLQQQLTQANRQVAAEHQKVQELLHAAREEVRPYKAFVEAKKLYDAGDLEAAIKTAFGDDASGFNKKLLRAVHGKNPEVEAVRAELQALKAEQAREREEYARQVAERQERAQVQQNLSWVAQNLPEVDGDFDYSAAAQKPAFVRRVLEVLYEHYDESSNVTLPLAQAAEMVRQEFEENYGASFAPRGAAVTATSVRGGSNPARPEAKPSKTLSQTGAAEASAPQRGAHGLSLDEHVRMFANGAH